MPPLADAVREYRAAHESLKTALFARRDPDRAGAAIDRFTAAVDAVTKLTNEAVGKLTNEALGRAIYELGQRLDAYKEKLLDELRRPLLHGMTMYSPAEVMRAVAKKAGKADGAADQLERIDDSWQLSSPAKKEKRQSKIALALIELTRHPDSTVKAIARKVGCNPKYLSQSKVFKDARKVAKEIGRGEIPRGSKGKDGTLEAYDD
jgi:hypothetical protein